MLETLLRRLDMVRLTIALMAIVMAVGCAGLIDDGGTAPGSTPESAEARRLWLEKALPQLTTNCKVCHDGSRANIGFLAGTSDVLIRDTVVAYTPAVVNTDAPGSSRLLTKGLHEGPALDAVQTSDILEWIQAERDAALNDGEATALIATEPSLIQICTSGLPDSAAAPNPNCPVNNVSLDSVGVAGGKISFVVQALQSGLYMTNLRLVPGTGGAFIEHPLIVAVGVGATRSNCEVVDAASGSVVCADTLDRFFNVKMNLATTATSDEQLIGGGAGAFIGFLPTDKISIHFKAAKAFQSESGTDPLASGCKDLAKFKVAKTAFTATVGGSINRSCFSCHGGTDANATATMTLTQINSADDTMLLTACNQVRSRINLQDFNTSSIVLAVDPANTNHPVKFNAADHTTFKNRINNPDPAQSWFVAERDLP